MTKDRSIEVKPTASSDATRREPASRWSYRPRIDVLENADELTISPTCSDGRLPTWNRSASSCGSTT